MNVLHVSETDLVGGRFTGYYMQQAVEEVDAHFEMAVWDKESHDPTMHQIRTPKPSLFWLVTGAARRLDDRLGLEGLTGLGSFVLPLKRYFRRADVVHLHLIHNRAFFSILALPMLSRLKPLVWSIHDCWPITGMCIHPLRCRGWLNGCKDWCPHPRGNSPFGHRIPALHWRIKQITYKRTQATLTTASKFMRDRVRTSPLLGHLTCHLIPYGIDLESFAPRSRLQCRERLGISANQRVLAFRGIPLQYDPYKGMRWLKEALTLYQPREPTCLLIVDDGRDFVSLQPKYSVINLGWTDGDRLVDALCAADVFLMPSIQEAFGLMAVESMACGTPVVVCEGTALPAVIEAPRGGLAVPPRDATALAGAIERLLEDESLREKLGRQGREIAEQEYSLPQYVQRHIRVYEAAMEKHRMSTKA
jgi:glycosyltransferase involved in cell wall biosynthesis